MGQYKMRVDADPFPAVNMVDQVNCGEEAEHSARRRLDLAFNINMANPHDATARRKRESIQAIGSARIRSVTSLKIK